MKKLILSLILVISFTFSYAQKSNVSKAKNKALMENPEFAAAREAIKLALQDSTTKKDANTWYVAGLIGNKENEALYAKALLKQPYDTLTKGKAIMESYSYFLEASKLDQLPNEKGKVKPRFSKEIKAALADYYRNQYNLLSYGAFLSEKKDLPGAIKAFEVALEIPKLPLMNNEISTKDTTYYTFKYWAGRFARDAKMHDKAIDIFEDLKKDNYETNLVYQLLYEEYLAKKDTVGSIKVLKEGLEKFPSESYFLQNLINCYIFSGKTNEAITYLTKAIEREPNITQYHRIKGDLNESLGNFDAALASFNKAIELDPTFSEAYAGKGRLYYNKAVKMSDEANKIKDVKAYNAELKKVDAVFKESLPFFKKASELKPKDIEYKRTLKTLYYRLKMDAEYEAIGKEINAM